KAANLRRGSVAAAVKIEVHELARCRIGDLIAQGKRVCGLAGRGGGDGSAQMGGVVGRKRIVAQRLDGCIKASGMAHLLRQRGGRGTASEAAAAGGGAARAGAEASALPGPAGARPAGGDWLRAPGAAERRARAGSILKAGRIASKFLHPSGAWIGQCGRKQGIS